MGQCTFLLIIYLSMGFATALKMNIPSGGFSVDLKPRVGTGLVETVWELSACTTCKLVLNCYFETTSCDDIMMTIDNGEEIEEFCPEHGAKFMTISFRNKMKVMTKNFMPKPGVKCKIVATESFLDQPDTKVNSKEYGLENRGHEKPSCRCGWSNKTPQRIVGGEFASLHEFPFMVRLKEVKSGDTFCGGAIITHRHILTAAHCIQPRRKIELSVLIGEHDLSSEIETNATREISVERYHIFSEYSPFKPTKDLAILRLKEEIKFNNLIGPVCMPKAQRDLLGRYIKVLGWGYTKDLFQGGKPSSILKKVNLKVIEPSVCKVIYNIDEIENNIICTYSNNMDSCSGDSGGPLIHINEKTNMYTLVAAVSLGRRCASTDPAMNTDVAFFLDWIKEKIEETKGAELCY